jgi:hypothetical protein
MDPAALAKVLRSSDGPVVRRLMQDGQAVKAEARRIVRVHKPVPGEKRSRRPGTLRDSIVMRVRPGPVIEVGSEDKIALIEHDGTEAHDIFPRSAPRLVFWSGKLGRVIYMPKGRKVRHPGTTGSRYLVRALAVLRSRY